MSEGLSAEFKQHFLGTHFFNPVRYMKLLEIIPGEETLPEVLDFMADFGERILGKGIVWAKDTPNFVGNRIGVQGMVKTMQLMLEEGMTIPEVDALFGPAMGRPKTAMFKTADLVGLDTMGHVAKNTYELVADDEARDDFVMPEFVGKMIEKQDAGEKDQGGFYKTDLTPEWKKIRKVIDPATMEYASTERWNSLPGRRQGRQNAAREDEGRGLRRRQGRQVCLEGDLRQPDLRRQPDSGNLRHHRRDRQCHEMGLQLRDGPLRDLGCHRRERIRGQNGSRRTDRSRIRQSHAGGRQ
jgi:3-hydroxyacyl-CoA dehydrogenase